MTEQANPFEFGDINAIARRQAKRQLEIVKETVNTSSQPADVDQHILGRVMHEDGTELSASDAAMYVAELLFPSDSNPYEWQRVIRRGAALIHRTEEELKYVDLQGEQ